MKSAARASRDSGGAVSLGAAPAPRMLNLPNFLSLTRILLVPFLVVALLTRFEGKEFVGLGVFLVAAATDLFDGWIARRRRQITKLGKLLDPAADKILISAAFISLVQVGEVPAWMVVVLVSRDFAVSALRSVAASEQVIIAAGWAGTVKTVIEIAAIALLIFHNKLGDFRHLAPFVLWLALAASVWSGLEYFLRFGRRLVLEAPPSAVGE